MVFISFAYWMQGEIAVQDLLSLRSQPQPQLLALTARQHFTRNVSKPV
jgi:hypothetical protein